MVDFAGGKEHSRGRMLLCWCGGAPFLSFPHECGRVLWISRVVCLMLTMASVSAAV